MEYLANATGFVAAVFKQLRQRHDGRRMRADERLKIIDLNRFGPTTREKRSARRVAKRKLAIGSIKLQALFRQCVDVWGLDLRVPITAEFGPKVIDSDKQDIEFRRRLVRSEALIATANQEGKAGKYSAIEFHRWQIASLMRSQ